MSIDEKTLEERVKDPLFAAEVRIHERYLGPLTSAQDWSRRWKAAARAWFVRGRYTTAMRRIKALRSERDSALRERDEAREAHRRCASGHIEIEDSLRRRVATLEGRLARVLRYARLFCVGRSRVVGGESRTPGCVWSRGAWSRLSRASRQGEP